MGCIICDCNSALSNTGTRCTPVMGVAEKLIFVTLKDSAGNENRINLLSDTLNDVYVDAKINNTDWSKRWYITPSLKNVTSEKADAKVETFNDGTMAFIQEGERTFTGLFVKGTPKLKGAIDQLRCVPVGLYIIDKNGSLIGEKIDNYLYPIALENGSVQAKMVFSNDSAIQKVEIRFNFAHTSKDENLRMIKCDSIPANLLIKEGLLDVDYKVISLTEDTLVVSLYADDGLTTDPIEISGLTQTDFSITCGDGNTEVPGTIDNFAEVNGTYTIGYDPSQPMTVTYIKVTITKAGFDFAINGVELPVSS